MSLWLLVVGLGLTAMPALLRRVGRRSTDPATWLRCCQRSLIAAVVAIELGLVMTAAPTVFRALGVNSLAESCARFFDPLQPGGAVVAWLAAGLASYVPAAAMFGLRRAVTDQRRARIDATVGSHRTVSGVDFAIVPVGAVLAYSVDVDEPQIVLSTGMLDSLRPDEVDLVLGHELAHLHYGHGRTLRLLSAARAALGPLTAAADSEIRLAIERVADEAVTGVDDTRRREFSEALLRSTGLRRPPVAALSPADTLAERVGALERRPRRSSVPSRLAMQAPFNMLTVVAAMLAITWMTDVGGVVVAAGRCPILRSLGVARTLLPGMPA